MKNKLMNAVLSASDPVNNGFHFLTIDDAADVAKEHAKNTQLFLLNEIINNGLQLRRSGEKNTMQWWYADGSNVEGGDLESLFVELGKREQAQ